MAINGEDGLVLGGKRFKVYGLWNRVLQQGALVQRFTVQRCKSIKKRFNGATGVSSLAVLPVEPVLSGVELGVRGLCLQIMIGSEMELWCKEQQTI